MGKRSQAGYHWLTMSQRIARGEAKSGARWLKINRPKPIKKTQ